MIPARTMAQMARLGLSDEQAEAVAEMLRAVEDATIAQAAAAIEARRANDRARKTRQRHVKSRDITGQHGTSAECRDGVSLNDSPALTTTVENNLNPSPTPPIAPPAPTSRSAWWPKDGFQRFWALYPRKTAKDAAERAYRRIERRVDLTFDELMAGVQRFVDSEPEAQFTPHPASWLNAGRWSDEIPLKAPANVTRFGGRHVPETRDAHLAATALHEWTLAEEDRDRGAPLLQIGRG